MNLLIILVIAAVIIIYLGFKWNNLRTKFAFFFILFGVLVVLFFVFLMMSGSNFNFSSLGDAVSSMRVSFLWIKGAIVHAFEITGKAIGLNVGNSSIG
jgi:hypothetical protein